MSISASLVKELREKTGCPMMDCKKALLDSAGDLEAAADLLRKRGHESAAKRKDRATAEGVVAGVAAADNRRVAIVELLCETDFVARNDDFGALAKALAEQLLAAPDVPADTAGLLAGAAGDKFRDVQTTLKENLQVGRFVRLDAGENERADLYAHFNGKIAAALLIGVSSPALAAKAEVQDLQRDLCMQAAFSNPLGIRREDVPADLVEKEKALFAELEEVKAKPEKIRPKIIEGKLTKFYKDNAFLEQEFVKEKKISVQDVVKRVAAAAGGTIEIRGLVRYEIGNA